MGMVEPIFEIQRQAFFIVEKIPTFISSLSADGLKIEIV